MIGSASASPPVPAIVLAAGWSSRMGDFKPLMPFGPSLVVERVVASLATAGVAPIRVVVGHRGGEVAARLAGAGVTIVANPSFDHGMYSSIRAGIASLAEDAAGVLLLPVDIPLVRPATIARIVTAARASAAASVHPTFQGERGHPPWIARRLFGEILLGDGEGGLRALLDRHEDEAEDVAVFDRGILCDMDRPEDHRRLLAALSRRHAPERAECEAMLGHVGVEERVLRHSRAVAKLAGALSERLIDAGVRLDPDTVTAGALLHDIAKGHPHHAEIGAGMITDFGFPAVGAIVARHMKVDFTEGEPLDEAAVVHLADKLVCEDRRVTLAERFAPALRRFRDDPAALAGAGRRMATAQAILRAVEALVPLPDEEISPPPVTAVRSLPEEMVR